MDLLFQYNQTKKFKNTDTDNRCSLRLYEFENLVHFTGEYNFSYSRYGTKHTVEIEHLITINVKNGDIDCTYRIGSQPSDSDTKTKSKPIRKTNNFSMLFEMIENGLYRGEKRRDYWGRKFNKSLEQILYCIEDVLGPHLQNSFYQDKDYSSYTINPIYELLVDFHLHKKKIKAHDSVYHTIQYDYPKPKWLKLNDNKFLPAVLDSYGIKTKYFISEINKKPEKIINIKTLSRLCKLFGNNYIDYIRKFNWEEYCLFGLSKSKSFELKNDSEKKCLLKVLNSWDEITFESNPFMDLMTKMLSTRDFLESKNIKLNFNPKDTESFEILFKEWDNMKNHFKKDRKSVV